MKICIDPGHGGHDSGAVGQNGLEEANTVLSMSIALADKFADVGIDTLLTRETDVFIELWQRCDISNRWDADYFISMHLNSNGSTAVGIETLYTSDTGKEIAESVQTVLIEETGDTDRGVKERDDLYVLNGTNCPAILIESGFISHPKTEEKLRTDEYKETLVNAVFVGMREYLGWDATEDKVS